MNIVYWQHYHLPSRDPKYYRQMLDLSVASAKRYLAGRWEPVIQTGDLSRRSGAEALACLYVAQREFIHECWRRGDNVLCLDQDCLFVKRTKMFGRFPEFRLFWATDPPKDKGFNPYLNGGVVYAPATMAEELWNLWTIPIYPSWGDEQVVLNRMFYAQTPVPELHPELNWSPWVPSPIGREDAHIFHVHSSRGPVEALDEMKQAARL